MAAAKAQVQAVSAEAAAQYHQVSLLLLRLCSQHLHAVPVPLQVEPAFQVAAHPNQYLASHNQVTAAVAQCPVSVAHFHPRHLQAKAVLFHPFHAALHRAVPQDGLIHPAAPAAATPRAVRRVVLQAAAPQRAPVQAAHRAAAFLPLNTIPALLVQVVVQATLHTAHRAVLSPHPKSAKVAHQAQEVRVEAVKVQAHQARVIAAAQNHRAGHPLQTQMSQFPSAAPAPASAAKVNHVQARPQLQIPALHSQAKAPAAQYQAVQTYHHHTLPQAGALQSDQHPAARHAAALLSGRFLQAAHPAATRRAVLVAAHQVPARMKAPVRVVVLAAATQ